MPADGNLGRQIQVAAPVAAGFYSGRGAATMSGQPPIAREIPSTVALRQAPRCRDGTTPGPPELRADFQNGLCWDMGLAMDLAAPVSL